MGYSVFGYVIGARRFTNGNIEIDFFHDDDKTTILKYSIDSKDSNLTQALADNLANTLGTDICVEIFFDNDANITHIEFEECDYDDDTQDLR